MKILNDPLSVTRVIRRNISKYKIDIAFVFTTLLVAAITYNTCETNRRQQVFDKLDVTFKEIKAVEYGTANFNPMDLVEEVPYGNIITYTNYVDTNSVGTQTVTFVVEEENIKKVVNVDVEIVDTEKPEIKTEKETISIKQGDDYDANDNIASVIDKVDGNLKYVNEDQEEGTAYYTVTTNLDTNTVGTYSVNIKAVDQNGNVSEKKYDVNVVEKPKPKPVIQNKVNNNATATVDTSSVVSAAYSYLGYNYTPGGANPSTGFDCSGFVYYIYGLFGKNVGRSTTDQLYAGTAVSRDSMQPGDIILWSDNGYSPTHATLYVGNDTMIHAANSRDGVIKSSVSAWASYGSSIVSIRRV